LSASGTDDTSWIKESEEFRELVDRLWEKWKGMKITLDARKRANRLAFTNFLASLVAAAYEAGIEDPLKVIDWEHVLDPGLSQAENTHIFEEQYHVRVTGRRRRSELPPMAEDRELLLREQIRSTESMIRDLDFEIRYGEDIYGNKLTPEQIEDAKRRKAELEKELEEARRELEEIEKRKPLPTPERGRGAPLPRRRARPAEEVAPAPAPQPAPPPAPAPPAAPTPEEERERLWEAFSIALVSAGLDPTEFREDFEGAYRAVANRPYAEKFNAVMRMASEIIRERMPRVPVALRETLESLREELRKGLEDIAQGLNRPVTPQEYLAAAEAELASVPPEESVESIPVSSVKQTPQECGGHTHVWVPNADALGLMRTYGVSTVIIRKFYTCPETWRYEADGNADLEYTVAVMKEVGEVPPFFAEWLMELAKTIDDKYEQEGRLEGIARYRDLKKRLGGRFTAVGK